jgi:hypothetical protein
MQSYDLVDSNNHPDESWWSIHTLILPCSFEEWEAGIGPALGGCLGISTLHLTYRYPKRHVADIQQNPSLGTNEL